MDKALNLIVVSSKHNNVIGLAGYEPAVKLKNLSVQTLPAAMVHRLVRKNLTWALNFRKLQAEEVRILPDGSMGQKGRITNFS